MQIQLERAYVVKTAVSLSYENLKGWAGRVWWAATEGKDRSTRRGLGAARGIFSPVILVGIRVPVFVAIAYHDPATPRTFLISSSRTMPRPILLLGGLAVLIMCLIPPFHTGPVDDVSDMLGGEQVRQVEYHPVWTRPEWQSDGPLSSVQNWEIVWGRLLLQILGVVLLMGGAMYLRSR